MILRAIARLRAVVDRDRRLDQPQRAAVVLRGLGQRERVLREARAAIAGPGMQELRADALVEPDALRDLLHVGAGLLAEIGDLVDEGDLHRQERVGRILDQLGRTPCR